MLPSGETTGEFIDKLSPLLQKDAIVIDGGNSLFKDTIRRSKDLEAKGFRYIGTGVSGGEEGALKGPAIMPGGTPASYDLVKDLFLKILNFER